MADARHCAGTDLAGLARAAARGDDRAWRELVARFDGVLRAVARGYRLPPDDVDDVVQTTWLRALEHARRIHEPAAIAGWLVTTARREAMRTLQRSVRELVTDDPTGGGQADFASPEDIVLARERGLVLRDAIGRLAGRQRELLMSMLASAERDYEQLACVLDMPIGSIGPTRQRALARLREDIRLEGVVS